MRSSRFFHRPTARAVLVAAAASAVLLPIARVSSTAPPARIPGVVRPTTVQVASTALNPTAIVQGAPVTLIAAVTPATATGTVQFMDGATALGAPARVTQGIASTTTSTAVLASGPHALTAVFTPTDKAYGLSNSPALSLTVVSPQAAGSPQRAPQPLSDAQSLDQPAPRTLTDGPLGIPGVMLDAYQRAERVTAQLQPGCHLSWATLAGIGKVESGHARGGRVDAAGNTLGQILGPPLDGSLDTVAIPDSDHSTLDGETQWARAIGPMQFIPSSWRAYGVGNPNNIYDSTIAAGRYLCAGGADLAEPTQQAAAIYRYNHSALYVSNVMRWAQGYLTGVVPTPSEQGPVPQLAAAVGVQPIAQRSLRVVTRLDAPAVVNLDSRRPAQLDAQSTPPAAPAPAPLSLDSPH